MGRWGILFSDKPIQNLQNTTRNVNALAQPEPKNFAAKKKTTKAIRPPSTIGAVETDSLLLQSAPVAMRQVRRFESQNSWKLLLMAHLSCSAASTY